MVKSKKHAVRGTIAEVGDIDGRPTVALQVGKAWASLHLPVTADEAREWAAHLGDEVEITVTFEVIPR
jgi:hypothetical protein